MVAVCSARSATCYRHDKRMPFVDEGYVDINPADAQELGVEDGDYVWIDADPEDRPFRGWQKNKRDYKFARLLCRARYYPGTPRGVTRMWHNMYGATPGSVEGQRTRRRRAGQESPHGLPGAVPLAARTRAARAAGSKPTWMTDSLVRKGICRARGSARASCRTCIARPARRARRS